MTRGRVRATLGTMMTGLANRSSGVGLGGVAALVLAAIFVMYLAFGVSDSPPTPDEVLLPAPSERTIPQANSTPSSPVTVDFRRFSIEVLQGNLTVTGYLAINASAGEICYRIELPGVASGHLHQLDKPGKEAIRFPAPPQGGRPKCQAGLDKLLLQEVIGDPDRYYVEFHGLPEDLPGGWPRHGSMKDESGCREW